MLAMFSSFTRPVTCWESEILLDKLISSQMEDTILSLHVCFQCWRMPIRMVSVFLDQISSFLISWKNNNDSSANSLQSLPCASTVHAVVESGLHVQGKKVWYISFLLVGIVPVQLQRCSGNLLEKVCFLQRYVPHIFLTILCTISGYSETSILTRNCCIHLYEIIFIIKHICGEYFSKLNSMISKCSSLFCMHE